jgi:hypothetical protein
MTSQIKRQRRVRRWHRVIAMLTSVQLLLWTLSGVYFSFVDIDYVRGHQYEAEAPSRLFDLSALQKISVSGQRMTILERLPGELIVGVRSEGVMSWRNAQGDALGLLVISGGAGSCSAAHHVGP